VTDTRVRPLALVVALLLVLGVAGALTVDEDDGGTVLTTAAAATVAEGSARMAMEMHFEVDGQRTTINADGLVDLSDERMQLTMRSAAFPAPMELIGDGSTVYIKANSPELAAEAGGKQWLAYDAKAFSQAAGNALGGGTDPLAMLELLEQRGIATNLRQEGGEPVRGAATTRYTADLDLAELLETFQRSEIRDMADEVDNAAVMMTVWVGDDSVVRRSSIAMRFDLEGSSVATTITMELFDFGVAIDVAPPPADQVKRAGDILRTG
jgi:hypothetical protein